MPPSPPVGGEGWGEAAAPLFVPVLGARQLVRGETDFLPVAPAGDAALTNGHFLADTTKDAE